MGGIKDEEEAPMSPRQIAQRAFFDVKDQLKFSSAVLVDETPELKALEKAAACCQKAIDERKPQQLREAEVHVKKAAEQILVSSSARIDQEEFRSQRETKTNAQLEAAQTLEVWRPGRRNVSRQRQDTELDGTSNLEHSTKAACGQEPPVETNNVEEHGSTKKVPDAPMEHQHQLLAKAPHEEAKVGVDHDDMLQRKREADISVKDNDYISGLREYEALLEDIAGDHVGSEIHIALLLNSAFCCLKLSAGQTMWARAKQLLKRALVFCDVALRFDSSNAKAHFRRGCVFEALENYNEAREAYERALRYEPADTRIRAGLARVARYICFELTPEKAAKAAAKEVSTKNSQVQGTKHETLRLGACCRCAGEIKGDGYFVVPCDHGPFCGQCKAWIEREGRGLPLCTACKQHSATTPRTLGVVERWEIGSGMLIKPKVSHEARNRQKATCDPESSALFSNTSSRTREAHNRDSARAKAGPSLPIPTVERAETTELSCMD